MHHEEVLSRLTNLTQEVLSFSYHPFYNIFQFRYLQFHLERLRGHTLHLLNSVQLDFYTKTRLFTSFLQFTQAISSFVYRVHPSRHGSTTTSASGNCFRWNSPEIKSVSWFCPIGHIYEGSWSHHHVFSHWNHCPKAHRCNLHFCFILTSKQHSGRQSSL